ncbi:MAG: phosphohistidine phosphatase SixA [Thermoanaerobaculia bacterium]
MNLFLLRHAEAEDRSSSGKDADRVLTRKGRETAKSVAAVLARLEQVEAIWHSPLARARETASIVAKEFPKAAIWETPSLLPEASPGQVLEEISGRRPGEVVLVGHQPHLGVLLALCVTGSSETRIPMRKASAARIKFAGSHASPPGKLMYLVSPDLAAKL